MSTVTESSIIYRFLSGENKGRLCRLYLEEETSSEVVTVVFTDHDCNSTAIVERGHLSRLKDPGWKWEGPYEKSYDLSECNTRQQGNGSNMLRTSTTSQPRALILGDELASGDFITKDLRMGYNSSVLVHLSRYGWVELAGRLPIALIGNESFKMPFELTKGDVLITGCEVVEKPTSAEAGWTEVPLDRKSTLIKTPSCIPLALA